MLFEFWTTTGEGDASVNVRAYVSGDGEDDEHMLIEDLEVVFKGIDIVGALPHAQQTKLEEELGDAYLKWAQDSNDDLAINRYLSNLEYREGSTL